MMILITWLRSLKIITLIKFMKERFNPKWYEKEIRKCYIEADMVLEKLNEPKTA